ncbi:MAG TPA: hypothetical protein VGF74_12980 [Thermoleophilaceae bacterium]
MRPLTATAVAVLIAAISAGCGGGSHSNTNTSAAQPPTSDLRPPTSQPQTAPTATTNTPPKKHRTKPQPLEPANSSTQPLTAGSTYKCGGGTLKTIDAHGPIVVKPAVVKPGETFTVTITAKNAHVAVVSLAGVSDKPIQANAKPEGGNLVATIHMPPKAGCGNKLLDIEGDLTAEAFIGVS